MSYEQLVGYIPELLDELTGAFDVDAGAKQITHHARKLRHYAQTRFQQNCLIDEALRELMILRGVVNEVMWDDADTSHDERDNYAVGRDESDSFGESNFTPDHVKETESDEVLKRGELREGSPRDPSDIYEIRDALRRTQQFFDEIMWQTVMIYAASQRPPVPTRTTSWHLPLLPRRELTDIGSERKDDEELSSRGRN